VSARWILAPLLAAIALATTTTPASAATCADYATQAAAQHAVDSGQATIRDPDNDGRICVISPR